MIILLGCNKQDNMSYTNRKSFKPKRKQKKAWQRGYDPKEFSVKPVPVFTAEEREEMHKTRTSFEDIIIERFDSKKMLPQDLVEEARIYFKQRFLDQKAKGIKRKTPWLCSCASGVSRLKAKIRKLRLASYLYYIQIRLTEAEIKVVKTIHYVRMEDNASHIRIVDATKLLTRLYDMLDSENPLSVIVAVLGLTGRRHTEATCSMSLDPPKQSKRYRYPCMWSHVRGFNKNKNGDRYAVTERELPLLCTRVRLKRAYEYFRDNFPSDTVEQAASLYGKKVVNHVKLTLGDLGVTEVRGLRKIFVAMAYTYFNNNKSSITFFASMVLGHKRRVSSQVLTYMSASVTNIPTLDWILKKSDANLSCTRPEIPMSVLTEGEPGVETPSSTEEEEKDVIGASDIAKILSQ